MANRDTTKSLSDSGAVSYVLDRVDALSVSHERRAFERLWFGNFNYFAGAQAFFQTGGSQWAPRQLNPKAGYHQANMILPKVIRAIAKILQINPTFRVAPNSSSRQDRNAAKIAEKVYKHLRQQTGFRKYRQQWLQDAALYGSGFLKITWDPDAGRPGRVYLREDGTADSNPHFDPEAKRQAELNGKFKDIPLGEVRMDVVSPFQVYWPTACRTDISECEWIAQISYISPDQAFERYGVRVETAGAVNQAEMFQRAMAFSAEVAAGLAPVDFGHVPFEGQERVREIEFWERPLERNAMRGRRLVLLGEIATENDDNPYTKTENPIPFVKNDWFGIPGKRFIGLGLVEQLRFPQRAYNNIRSHEIGFAKTAGHARMVLPAGCGAKPIQVSGIHAQVLEVNMAGGVPIFSPVPNMPPFVGELRGVARDEMDLISAQTEPSNSKLPGQVRSGSGISMVQADQNLVLTPVVESHLIAQAESGKMMLALVAAYYDTPRVLQVLGRGNEYDPIAFMGADLRGHMHLQLTGEPGPIESAEAWRSRIGDMVELGLLDPTNPEDRMLALKAMEFSTDQELMSVKILQEIAEERELQRMIDIPDYLPRVQEWHDPEVRIRVLERELNGRDFAGYDGLTQRKIVERWQQYVQIMAARMKAQMEMMQAAQGTPGESGQPSRPKRART